MMFETLEASSLKIYEDLDWFRRQTQKKKPYLNAIDTLVINESGKHGNYLDVGAGPGLRAMSIAQGIEAKTIYLNDLSPTMAAQWKSLPVTGTHVGKIETFQCDLRFETVTCLWSVLAHVEEPLALLKALFGLMKPGGQLFLDVNNRYNICEYGWRSVTRNQIQDLLRKKGRGRFPLSAFPQAQVRVFNPYELDSLLKTAGFSYFKKKFIHYATGRRMLTPHGGQVFYSVTKI